jgi:prolyl-tRNA synthetase
MTQFHRWSELFIPTLREAPADAATASHTLLLRSGYVRQMTPAVHSYLFLGQRSLSKIKNIVRAEMNKIGHEFCLLASSANETWEILLDIVRKDLRSYKQLPQVWYHTGVSSPGDRHNNSGLLRARQSITANSISVDIDPAGANKSYRKHFEAYGRILNLCQLKYRIVAARGTDEDVQSQTFIVLNPFGDSLVVQCKQCGYSADSDNAVSATGSVQDLAPEGNGAPLLVHTPAVKTIGDLAQYLNVSPKNSMKTLAFIAEDNDSRPTERQKQAVVAFLRGDHELKEAKLSKAIGGRRFRPMEADEILQLFGSPAGFLGPLGLTVAHEIDRFGRGTIVLVDSALQGRSNLVAGANKEDFHLKNITPGKDFQPSAYADLRAVNDGEACTNCGHGLTVHPAIQIANLSKLPWGCAETSGARVLDHNGKQTTPSIGSYAISIERILIAAVEQNHDDDGFWLPPQIAPFEVIVTPISVRDHKAISAALDCAAALASVGLDVVLDDRDERPGVKFKDADLVGMPYRINVGKKVTEGTVEVVNRSTHEIRDASITAIAEYMQRVVRPSR